MCIEVLICGVNTWSYSSYSGVLSISYYCQIWNEKMNTDVEKPFKDEPLQLSNSEIYLQWLSEESDQYKYMQSNSQLTLYNGKPAAINEYSKNIKSLSSKGEWITVATFSYFLDRKTFVILDSGDLLIIGFQRRKKYLDKYQNDHYRGSAEIYKLQNDKLTRIGSFNKVFFYSINQN